MSSAIYEKIRSNPKYQQLKSTRDSYGWIMTILMLVVYYGYIAMIAFNKAALAAPLGATGVTTVGKNFDLVINTEKIPLEEVSKKVVEEYNNWLNN